MKLRISFLFVTGLFYFSHTAQAQPTCPSPPAVVINNPQPPSDVCLPAKFSGIPFQFFDDFSWRSFIALVWPALTGQRGKPDTTKSVGDAGPRVFETYKQLASGIPCRRIGAIELE